MQVSLIGQLERKTKRHPPTPEFLQVIPWIWRTLDGYRSGRLVPPPFAARGWKHSTRLPNGHILWVYLRFQPPDSVLGTRYVVR